MRQVFAGIDLGGTTTSLAIADHDGTVVAEDKIATQSHDGPMGVLQRIGDGLESLIKRTDSDLAGIGMGVPGLVDLQSGTTKFLPNLPTQWRDVGVADYLSDRLSCPTRLLNDVRCATLGELRFGHGKSQPKITMAFFSIGTGIGGGVAIDGQLRLGPLGAAGELGHQTIDPNGPRCGCGNRGCLEAIASGPAITAFGVRMLQSGLAPQLHKLVDGQLQAVSPATMLRAAESGDQNIADAIKSVGQAIGIAAANVVTIIHPELIVIGGGVSELDLALIRPIREVIQDRVGMFPTEDVRVEKSKLGDRAGIFGAIALAQQAT